MKELAEIIIKELATNKDAVKVDLVEEKDAFVLKITVAEADLGRVIGKMGKTANAIRTIIRSFAGKLNKKLIIKIN